MEIEVYPDACDAVRAVARGMVDGFPAAERMVLFMGCSPEAAEAAIEMAYRADLVTYRADDLSETWLTDSGLDVLDSIDQPLSRAARAAVALHEAASALPEDEAFWPPRRS